jgi:hypothetical protein
MRYHNLHVIPPKRNHVPYELTAANVVRFLYGFLARLSLMNYATSASSTTAHPELDPENETAG